MGFDIGGLFNAASSIFKGVGQLTGNSNLSNIGNSIGQVGGGLGEVFKMLGDSREESGRGQSSNIDLERGVSAASNIFKGIQGGGGRGDGQGKAGQFGSLGSAIGGLFGKQQAGGQIGNAIGQFAGLFG